MRDTVVDPGVYKYGGGGGGANMWISLGIRIVLLAIGGGCAPKVKAIGISNFEISIHHQF